MPDDIPRIDVIPEDDLPVRVDRFKLLEILGEGGMGRVYRAEVQGLAGFRKECALKVVRRESVAEDIARDSFINEARLGGLLNHPNVVATLDFGQLGGLPYIAMELVDGVTVDRLLRRAGGMLPASVALDIGVQVCAGLSHAHRLKDRDEPANLVHRDLKPSNVIVSRHGVAKVMDFGIAKARGRVGEHTRTGVTKGTPHYMSPEQIEGNEVDQRSDVFAMGALLYAITTGKPLFAQKGSGGVLSVLLAISRVDEMLEDGELLAEIDALAPGLSQVLARCLRSDPAERFASAKALAVDLKLVKARLHDQVGLAEYVDALYGTDEFEVDIAPLYRLNTDTRDARQPAELDLQPDWQSSEDPDTANTVMHDSSGGMDVPFRPTEDRPAVEVYDTAISARRRRLIVILGLSSVLVGLLAVIAVLIVVSGALTGLLVVGNEDPTPAEDPTPEAVTEAITATPDDPPDEITPDEVITEAVEDVTAAVEPVTGEPATPDPVTAAPDGTGGDGDTARESGEDGEDVTTGPAPMTVVAVDAPTRVSVGFPKKFSVRVEGADDVEVTLMLRAEGQDWRLHRMQRESGALWSTSLTFEADMVGKASYYFHAQPAGDTDGRVYLGSRDSPLTIQVW